MHHFFHCESILLIRATSFDIWKSGTARLLLAPALQLVVDSSFVEKWVVNWPRFPEVLHSDYTIWVAEYVVSVLNVFSSRTMALAGTSTTPCPSTTGTFLFSCCDLAHIVKRVSQYTPRLQFLIPLEDGQGELLWFAQERWWVRCSF